MNKNSNKSESAKSFKQARKAAIRAAGNAGRWTHAGRLAFVAPVVTYGHGARNRVHATTSTTSELSCSLPQRWQWRVVIGGGYRSIEERYVLAMSCRVGWWATSARLQPTGRREAGRCEHRNLDCDNVAEVAARTAAFASWFV